MTWMFQLSIVLVVNFEYLLVQGDIWLFHYYFERVLFLDSRDFGGHHGVYFEEVAKSHGMRRIKWGRCYFCEAVAEHSFFEDDFVENCFEKARDIQNFSTCLGSLNPPPWERKECSSSSHYGVLTCFIVESNEVRFWINLSWDSFARFCFKNGIVFFTGSFQITFLKTIILYHYLSFCIIMYHYLSLSITIYHYVSLCIILYHFVSFSIKMYHYVSFSIKMYH